MRTLAVVFLICAACVLLGCSKPDESGGAAGVGPTTSAGRDSRSGLADPSADATTTPGADISDQGEGAETEGDDQADETVDEGDEAAADDGADANEQPTDEGDRAGLGNGPGGPGGPGMGGPGGPGMGGPGAPGMGAPGMGAPGGPGGGMGGGRGGPRSFEDLDANGDGKITKGDLPEGAQDRPLWGDANQDGVITREEFDARPRRGGGMGGPRSFEDIDTNSDGKVTKADMPDWMQDFPLFGDADGDGVLTKKEFDARPARNGPPSFEEMDSDGNGKVTKADLPEWMKDFPLWGDANEDGVLTKEEFDARPAPGMGGGMGGPGGPGGGGRGMGGPGGPGGPGGQR